MLRISCGSLLGSSCYSWRCSASMGGGVLALLASHIIDLTTFLGLGLATRVHANLRTLMPTTDNIGQRLIRAIELPGSAGWQPDPYIYTARSKI